MEQLGIQMLNLADLRPMENYRKSMDEKKLVELTESVRTKGVVQPILVRPNGKGYEIVFGQRRWMASKRAGLPTIPAMIRKVTDAEALELQVIENSQREDPNPMEEGLGFKKLLDLGKHTTETLAAKLDKSVDYVLGRMKLVNLPKEAQKKMLSGEIAIGHALQLTRLKNEGDMKRMLKSIVEDGMSVKQAKAELTHFFGKPMKEARFDISTGNCTNCPSRTKNQTVLFPDAAKDDQCLDLSCFFTRTREQIKGEMKDLAALGIKTITSEQQVDKMTSYGTNSKRINLEKGEYHGETPKRPSECRKCTKRSFYCFERKFTRRTALETGWICLDKKCLDKMNRSRGAGESASGSSRPAVRNAAVHARAVRDRFIYSAMPEKFESSGVLQKRLVIYHLLCQFSHLRGGVLDENSGSASEVRTNILSAFVPGRDLSELEGYFGQDDFGLITVIPAKDLDMVLEKAIKGSLRYTEPEVLLRMAPEAGIKMEKDFRIDRPYLNSMTKDDLVKFVKTLGMKDLRLDAAGKKTAMVDEILKHDLTGKVPTDVAEECELETIDDLYPKLKPAKAKKGKV